MELVRYIRRSNMIVQIPTFYNFRMYIFKRFDNLEINQIVNRFFIVLLIIWCFVLNVMIVANQKGF